MSSGPPEPRAEEPPRSPADAQTADQSASPGIPPPPATERYGPLSVLRTHKDDGRSLTLYSVAPAAGKTARQT